MRAGLAAHTCFEVLTKASSTLCAVLADVSCPTSPSVTVSHRPRLRPRPRLHYRLLTLCPAPTDPVPRGLLTLWARAGMCVCIYVFFLPDALSVYERACNEWCKRACN